MECVRIVSLSPLDGLGVRESSVLEPWGFNSERDLARLGGGGGGWFLVGEGAREEARDEAAMAYAIESSLIPVF